MSVFKANASTYHQKIKFSVGNRIGEVKGNQPFSRGCYAEISEWIRRGREKEKKAKYFVSSRFRRLWKKSKRMYP